MNRTTTRCKKTCSGRSLLLIFFMWCIRHPKRIAGYIGSGQVGPIQHFLLLKAKNILVLDKIGVARGYKRCLTLMWPTTCKCNFMTEDTNFPMPYYIFQGRHDNNIPSADGALLFYIDILLGLNESFATIVLAISIVVGICTYPLVKLHVLIFYRRLRLQIWHSLTELRPERHKIGYIFKRFFRKRISFSLCNFHLHKILMFYPIFCSCVLRV